MGLPDAVALAELVDQEGNSGQTNTCSTIVLSFASLCTGEFRVLGWVLPRAYRTFI